MQPNVKLNHNRITAKIARLLAERIDQKKWEYSSGDFAVRTGPESVRFADLMVFPAGKDGQLQAVDDPVIIFEVLSKSTMHEDFGAKRSEYLALESLTNYVVLSADEPQIWLWQRDDDGSWSDDPEQYGVGDIRLDTIGVSIPLSKLYVNITA